MRTMLLYFAAVLGVTVVCWLFEAMGIFGTDIKFYLLLTAGFGGIICAIERQGK